MAAAKSTVDPRVDKKRVTMVNPQVVNDPKNPGKFIIVERVAVDYVRPDHLDAYVEDAKTRWESVTVSDEPDAGPGGYEGQTHVPDHLPVDDAGTTYAAEEK